MRDIKFPEAATALRRHAGDFAIVGGWLRREIGGVDNTTCDIDIIPLEGFAIPASFKTRRSRSGSKYFTFESRQFNVLTYKHIDDFDFRCCQVAINAEGEVRECDGAIADIEAKRLVASDFTLRTATKELTRLWPRIAKFIGEGYSMRDEDLAAICSRWADVFGEYAFS